MAKKVETISLIDTFADFKETKNIDRTTMVSVLQSARSIIAITTVTRSIMILWLIVSQETSMIHSITEAILTKRQLI